MQGPTWGWTERHSAVVLVLVLGQVCALVGLVERPPVSLWVGAAVAVAAVLGLLVDVWAGALLGLASATGMVAVRRATGSWAPEDFTAAALETFAVVAVGAAAGRAGTVLRRQQGSARPASANDAQYEPVHGSLGLLGEHAAMARLQEEVARGERQLRPVTLALFDVVPTDATLTEPARQAACRAVARVVESRAGEHDIPFALSLDRLGIVFPDTTVGAVWDVVGRVLASVSTATFTDGDERTPRPLTSAVDVLVGISRQAREGSTAATMVADATTALARARVEEAAS